MPEMTPFTATNITPYMQSNTQRQWQTAQKPMPMASYNDPTIIQPNQIQFYQRQLPQNVTWDQTATYNFQNTQLPQYYRYPISPISDVPPVANPAWQNLGEGLKMQDVKEGFGLPAKPGNKLTMEYVGKLKSDGKIFDQSSPERPFTFTLGAGEVIDGWERGLVGMKVGGKRMLEIPPALAYGDAGAGDDIPPNATLVFEVTLKEMA